MLSFRRVFLFFFFNDTATTEIYTLSLHDALPIFTGICTVANDAQNGHSKSEYSVTSTGAASDPSVKPWNASAAATGSGALGAGGAALRCDWYHSAPPPITATATSNR